MAFFPDTPGRFVPEARNRRTIEDDIQHAALNPAQDMGIGAQVAAGAGKTMTDLGQGFLQRIGMGPSAQEVEARRDRDVSLMATPAGFAGSIGGGVAATLPTAALGPGVLPAIATGAGYGALQPTGIGESALMNTAIGGASAGLLKYGLDKAAPAIAGAIGRSRSAVAPHNARAEQLRGVFQSGRELGLRAPPATTNQSVVNRALESIAGKAATKQVASVRNQDVVYAAAQRYAGLPKNQALTAESLAQARNAAAEPYRAIAKLSPDANDALEAWKQANFEKNLQWNFFNKSGDPSAFKAATAADDTADAALDAIEAQAKKILDGPATADIIASLHAARRQIAKIYTIEKSMVGSFFDPAALARNVGKKPLEGEMKIIANFTRDFPKAMERPQLQGSPGVNNLTTSLGTGFGGTIGGSMAGPGGIAPGAALGFMAAQSVPPLARSLILSRPYQAAMASPQSASPAMANLLELLNTPETRGLLTGSAAMYTAGR